ncbi:MULTISPECIES: caspase family protein [Bacillus cereus group]|uniref:caspase family protein n=1 Tax=Bacillus cereus group TaxID=86661 RepID=UPI000BF8FF48|nr:caspase family protein [Bacillus cereus]PFC18831.1 hypothetical protein CN287_11635 [Bacillus cereus]
MNLAILLGVSEYQITDANLPGCKNDINLIKFLLEKTNKYQNILYINENTTSENVKRKITEFINKYQDHQYEIDEIFFYYTGHGQFHNDEFYYLLSNFDSNMRNTTSLKNSELDSLLRNLNPKLTVKVVDACQSGIAYVKEFDETKFEKAIDNSQKSFNNCYFMFSSNANQYSYASPNISDFTKSFLTSIVQSQDGSLRYLDIIDFIADDFDSSHSQQTPYFVTQGNYTELFCTVDNNLKQNLSQKLAEYTDLQIDDKVIAPLLLKDLIKQASSDYCATPEEAYKQLEHVYKTIISYNYSKQLQELYDIDIDETTIYSDLPKINLIGDQLSKEENYFVKFTYDTQKTKVPVPISPISQITHVVSGTRPEKKYQIVEKTVVSDIELTQESPFYRIDIRMIPKYPNLPGFESDLIIAFSKKELSLFYFHTICQEIRWNEFIINKNKINWKYKKFKLKNLGNPKEKQDLEKIFKDFETFILEFLAEKFKSSIDHNNNSTNKNSVPSTI